MIGTLRANNAEYDKKIAFIYADWDAHSNSPVSRNLKITRQSTLVMLTGNGEVGRLVAQTSTSAIKGLLDKAPARNNAQANCS